MFDASLVSYQRTGRGSEPLLLVHGLGSSHRIWAPLLPALEPRFDVVAVDLPGFGKTPPLGADETPDAPAMAETLRRFLEGIGVERPHVVGHSLGGWVALELAREEAVRTALAISPAGFGSDADLRRSARMLRRDFRLARRLQAAVPVVAATAPGRFLAARNQYGHPSRVPPEVFTEDVRVLAGSADFLRTLEHINAARIEPVSTTVPVTIAWCGDDKLLPPPQRLRARALVPGARVGVLPGCGHVPFHDDPGGLIEAIVQATGR